MMKQYIIAYFSCAKVLISLLMLMGRAGILTFGFALAVQGKEGKAIKKMVFDFRR
jgi:hypothetical protein